MLFSNADLLVNASGEAPFLRIWDNFSAMEMVSSWVPGASDLSI
jgi:hypothetical protein